MQVSLGLYVGHDRTKDATLGALLGEDNYAHVSQFGVARGVEAEVEWPGAEIFQSADVLQVADDTRVLKTSATVFSVANVSGIQRIDEGCVEFRI